MAVILEIKSGPFAGQRVAVVGGQTVTVGRTNRANYAIPHDTFMSATHFGVECGSRGCVLTDQKSSNGTFVNGERISQVLLKNCDEVRSGETIFVVRMVDEEPILPSARQATPSVKPVPLPKPLPVKPTERTVPLDQPQYNPRSVTPVVLTKPSIASLPSTRTPRKPLLAIGGWTF